MKPIALSFAIIASLLPAASLTADDDLKTYSLDGISKVDFQISGASVEVVGSDRSDLELLLTQPRRGFDPENVTQSVTREGDTLAIAIEYPRKARNGWFSARGKGYQKAALHLPSHIEVAIHTSGGDLSASQLDAPLALNTSGGDITVSDVDGPLSLKTSGGSLRLARIRGDINAQTSGGNIEADALYGNATLKTSGGSITLDGHIPELDARTSGGNLKATLHAPVTAPLALKTSGGNVTARLEQGFAAPVELRTSGGNVSLYLPSDQGFELVAKASGSRATFTHSGTLRGDIDKRKIQGSVNGGGPLVQLTTNGGRALVADL